MNIKGFLLFITVAWSLQAGEKRSHEDAESSHKMVRLSSVDQEIPTDPTSREAAAAAPREIGSWQKEWIKREFRTLIKSLARPEYYPALLPEGEAYRENMLEKLMRKHHWLIEEVLNKAPQSEFNESLVKEAIKSENYRLLTLLVQHGLQLRLHGDLFAQILGHEDYELKKETIYWMLEQKAVFTPLSLCALSYMYSDTNNESIIEDILLHYPFTIETETHTLLFPTYLIDHSKPTLLRLYLTHRERSSINNKNYEGNYLIFVATAAAIEKRNDPAERTAALEVIRILLAHGANPLLIDSFGNDPFRFAQQHNDQEVLDILNSYAVQSSRL